jgi:hypothetical protein
MRRLLVLILLVPGCLACVGCGGQPDPRDRPDFVDTTDPNVAADMLDSDRPAANTPGGRR